MRLHEGCDTWLAAGAELATRLREALGDLAVAVEHVGSTSVPGLVAKPILDIAVGARPEASTAALVAALQGAGLAYREDLGDEGGLLFVAEGERGERVAHAHVVEHGGAQWRAYLSFRDRLRSDPAARRSYAEAKHALAARFPDDRRAYSAGKAEIVEELLRGRLG